MTANKTAMKLLQKLNFRTTGSKSRKIHLRKFHVPENAPSLGSGTNNDLKTLADKWRDGKVLDELGAEVKSSGELANADVLRAAVFAGLLDHIMAKHSNLATKTLVRHYDDAARIDRLTPIDEFLGLVSGSAPVVKPINPPRIDPDQLTRYLRKYVYEIKDDDSFELEPWDGVHAPNTIGTVRALGWLKTKPNVDKPKSVDVRTSEFKCEDGAILKVCDSDFEFTELERERREQLEKSHGTGVNEFAPFVWCQLPLETVYAQNDPAGIHRFLDSFDATFDADGGKLVFRTIYALDDVAFRKLHDKARAINPPVVGPIKLSANVLMTDPSSDSLIIQKKRDPKKFHPRHTFGGSLTAANPYQGNSYAVGDDGDFVRCARREILEESNVALALTSKKPYEDIPALLMFQSHPPFLNVTFLGWEVPIGETEEIDVRGAGNDEGRPLRIPLTSADHGYQSVQALFPFDDGLTEAWRPAGLLAMFAWYKIGCPGISIEGKTRLEAALKKGKWAGAN